MSLLVEGHCSGISAGLHILSLWVGSCDGIEVYVYKATHTGSNENINRILIEEFRPNSNIIAGDRQCLSKLY